MRIVVDQHSQIGARGTLNGPSNALGLNRIRCFAKTCGIQQGHGNSTDIQCNFQDIASRTRNCRRDSHLTPGKKIHERRLADIRAPGNGNDDTPSEPFTRMIIREQIAKLIPQSLQIRQNRPPELIRQIVVTAKVDFSLDNRQNADELKAPRLKSTAQASCQLAGRLLHLRHGRCFRKIRHGFRLSQIHLSVQKRPSRELSRIRKATKSGPCENVVNGAAYAQSAMMLDFEQIFSGETRRCWKKQEQGSVEPVSVVGISDPVNGRHSRPG